MSVSAAPVDSDETPILSRMVAQHGYGWLLQDEGGHVPGGDWGEVGQEVIWVLAGAIFLTVLRVAFQSAFSAWWASHSFGAASFPKEDAIETQQRGERASESAWKALFYTPFWLCTVVAVSSQFWWSDTNFAFVGRPNIPISPLFRFVFLGELSFYVHSTIAHFTIEIRRGDFLQMALHHIVTASLMTIAYLTNYHRVGGILLLMHDVGDVLLEIGKVLLYAGFEKTSSVMLGLLIVLWWWFRCIFWGYKIFTATFYQAVWIEGPKLYMPLFWLFNVLLFTIWLLNFFWGYLLTRIAVRKVLGDTLVDTRDSKSDKHKKKL